MASVFFLAAALLQTLIMINGVAGEGLPSGSLRGSPEVQAVDASDTPDLVEMPDVGGVPDHPGPYAEEPNNTDAFKPKVANSSEEAGFCSVHQTGYWCNQSTRVRCCKLQGEGGYAKCGSTVNSSFCGWHNVVENDVPNSTNATLVSSWWPPYGDDRRRSWSPRRRYGGRGSWHIHRGWHVSSYCQSHHVGRFCSSHRIIHCCNDYGHYVECNSAYTHSSWWC